MGSNEGRVGTNASRYGCSPYGTTTTRSGTSLSCDCPACAVEVMGGEWGWGCEMLWRGLRTFYIIESSNKNKKKIGHIQLYDSIVFEMSRETSSVHTKRVSLLLAKMWVWVSISFATQLLFCWDCFGMILTIIFTSMYVWLFIVSYLNVFF